MRSLYEISNEFRTLYDSLEAIEESVDGGGNSVDLDDMRQAWFDTLEGIEMEAEDKLENIAKIYKQIRAERDVLIAEIDRLKARADAKKKTYERLEEYIRSSMAKMSLRKLDKPGALITSRESRSVGIADEKSFVEWAKKHNSLLLTVKAEEKPCKKAIKAALEAGEDIFGAKMITSTSVTIK